MAELRKKMDAGAFLRANAVMVMFLVLCVVCLYFSGYTVPYVMYELFGRLSRNAFIVLALILPIAYCLLDAAGTFGDSLVLDRLADEAMSAGLFATAEECASYAAGTANAAYELTFLLAAALCFIYVKLIKKEKFFFAQEGPKYLGAVCETAGQFAYIFALSDTAHVAIAAPIISAYCAASVVWSRIFLKEKLSWKHYAMIALVVIGIVMLGVFDI